MARDELDIFRVVVERRSFSAAADELGLDPSVVSRRIKALERRLGVALFLRSTRKVQPTEAALKLHARVGPALDAIHEAELQARTGGAALSGVVRVAAPAALGRVRVGPLVHAFCHQHPDVQVHLLLSDRRIDLIAENIDIAVRVGEQQAASTVVRRLGDSPQWLVASPGYLSAHPPLTPALDNLEEHRFVLRYQGGRLVDFRDLSPHTAGRGQTGFVSDDIGATMEAVRAGLGLCPLPQWLVAADVAAGRLVRLQLGGPTYTAPIYAVLPAGRQLTGRARALLEAMATGWPRTPA